MKKSLGIFLGSVLMMCADITAAQNQPAMLNCLSLRRAVLAMSEPRRKNQGQNLHRNNAAYATRLPTIWGSAVTMIIPHANGRTFFLLVDLSGKEVNYEAFKAQLEACLNAETLNWEKDGSATECIYYCDQLHLYITLSPFPSSGRMYLHITHEP